MSSLILTITVERRRNVFLAARAVFTGNKAFIRDRNTVEELITRHEKSSRKEVPQLGKQTIIDMILSLLKKQVFESEEMAKLVFPELYQVSAVRGLQHDTSEKNAARSEAEALEEVSRSEDVLYGADDVDDQEGHFLGDHIAAEASKPAESALPSLFPVYLSYPVQHKLLNTVQRLLEECCYDVAATWVPQLLADKRWDCAEAVEIGRWTEALPSRFDELSAFATGLGSSENLRVALKATHSLRHAAVHRLPTTGKGVERMLKKALYLVQVLHDDVRTSKLETLLDDFRARIGDMEIHKNHLENQLDEELLNIQEQRAALDRKEQDAKEHMLKQDVEHTKSTSSLFGRSIADLTHDSSKTETTDQERHEAGLVPLDDGMNPNSDVEPILSNRHRAKPSVFEDHENAADNLEHIYGKPHNAGPDAPYDNEDIGEDYEPMVSRYHEAELGPLIGLENTDRDVEPA